MSQDFGGRGVVSDDESSSPRECPAECRRRATSHPVIQLSSAGRRLLLNSVEFQFLSFSGTSHSIYTSKTDSSFYATSICLIC